MKICPKCNAQLADDSVFCTGCGQKIEEEKAKLEKYQKLMEQVVERLSQLKK